MKKLKDQSEKVRTYEVDQREEMEVEQGKRAEGDELGCLAELN